MQGEKIMTDLKNESNQVQQYIENCNNSDLVSIVIPVHNAEMFIRKTIDCVLAQSYTNWELLLVDDNSTDQSLNIMNAVSDSRIRVLRNPEPGSAARTRNVGIKEAKGRYLAFLDADDIWKTNKLSETLAFMKSKDASFVFTGYEFGDEEAVGTGKVVVVPERLTYEEALSRTIIFTSTVMFDLWNIQKELIYMPQVKSEDTATWWQILRTGMTAYGLNDNLVVYRRAGKSLSSNKIEAVRRIWNLLKMQPNLSFGKRLKCFVGWAFGAVARRI